MGQRKHKKKAHACNRGRNTFLEGMLSEGKEGSMKITRERYEEMERNERRLTIFIIGFTIVCMCALWLASVNSVISARADYHRDAWYGCEKQLDNLCESQFGDGAKYEHWPEKGCVKTDLVWGEEA